MRRGVLPSRLCLARGSMPGPIPHGAHPLTTVISFPGFPSGPQGPSPKTDLIRELGHDVALIATNGDYRPGGYPVALGRLGLDPTPPQVLMGTCLGASGRGHWARNSAGPGSP